MNIHRPWIIASLIAVCYSLVLAGCEPDPESRDVRIFSENGTAKVTRLDFWTLNSIWD